MKPKKKKIAAKKKEKQHGSASQNFPPSMSPHQMNPKNTTKKVIGI